MPISNGEDPKSHPGTIAYYENRNGREINIGTERIENVPESMHFCQTAKGWIPVVKVVTIINNQGYPREIIEYGPKNERLKSTYTPASR